MRRAERAHHHRKVPANLLPSAVFGSFDAINGVTGTVLGLLVGHARTHVILVVVLAGAGANTWSMAGGEYVSDEEGGRHERWARMGAMGIAFLLVSVGPPVGFFVGRGAGEMTMAALTVPILVAIAAVRSRYHGWGRGALTVGIIFTGAVLTAYGAATVGSLS